MRFLRVLTIVLIGWYCVLCAAHYFGQRPLWNDEQCVFYSIDQLKPFQLFSQPLLALQEFPRVYLWCIQQLNHSGGAQNLLLLRLLAFIAMIGAFFVWLKVVRNQSRDFLTLLLFIGCWCASIPLVYYAAELKQYSMDVLVSGLFMLFLYKQTDLQRTPGLYRAVLFLLPLTGLFSYPVIFLYPLPLFNLMRDAYSRRRVLSELSLYLAAGVLWVSFVYFFDYKVTQTSILQSCWDDHFIVFNSWGAFLKSFGQGYENITSRWFAERPKFFRYAARVFVGSGFLYMIINAGRIFKAEGYRFRSLVPAAFFIFVMHLVFGCLRKYPFAVPRVSLFFAPLLLWMTVLSMQWLRDKSKLAGYIVAGIFAVYLLCISLGIARVVFACHHHSPNSGPGLGAQSILWEKGS